jgi:hypothetical protein
MPNETNSFIRAAEESAAEAARRGEVVFSGLGRITAVSPSTYANWSGTQFERDEAISMESLQRAFEQLRERVSRIPEPYFPPSYATPVVLTNAPGAIFYEGATPAPVPQPAPAPETVLLRDAGGGEAYATVFSDTKFIESVPSGQRSYRVRFNDTGHLTPDSNGYRIFCEGTPPEDRLLEIPF